MKMASPWNAGETKRGEFLPHLALQAPLHSTQGEVLYEGLSSYNWATATKPKKPLADIPLYRLVDRDLYNIL